MDPLPKKLLLQLHREPDHPIALLDIDNVNEFRKKYDDSFYPKYRRMNPNMQQMRMKMKLQMQQKRQTLTGRKKAPPTRPYVHMLMLWVVCFFSTSFSFAISSSPSAAAAGWSENCEFEMKGNALISNLNFRYDQLKKEAKEKKLQMYMVS